MAPQEQRRVAYSEVLRVPQFQQLYIATFQERQHVNTQRRPASRTPAAPPAIRLVGQAEIHSLGCG